MSEQNGNPGPYSIISSIIGMLAVAFLPAFAHPTIIGCIMCMVGSIGLFEWFKMASAESEPRHSKDSSHRSILGWATCIVLISGAVCLYVGIRGID